MKGKMSKKGKKHTQEHNNNISRSLLGKKLSKEHIENIKKSHIGIKMSDSAKKKLSIYWSGRKRKPMSEEQKIKISKSKLGKKLSITTRFKIRETALKRVLSGKHNNYKGGITKENSKIRGSIEMKLWRESVFKRDNWTCGFCGCVGGKLNADHIKPFAYYPELRFAIDNGRTLCKPCHLKTNTWGNRIIKIKR